MFGVVARLAPGISMQHATDELMRIAAPAAADPHGGAVTPIREQFVRDARLPLLALTGAAVAFLLVACANLAALQISAFESRRAEIAVRAALGATAGRLAGQLAVEAMILALVAGVDWYARRGLRPCGTSRTASTDPAVSYAQPSSISASRSSQC